MTNSSRNASPTQRNSAPGVTAVEDRPPRPAPPPAPARTARDPFFDNAKFLAVILVGVGHAWEPIRFDSRVVCALYAFVYAFHMPAFIVVSGYMSRGFDAGRGKIRRLITGVLVPYLIFETVYTLFRRYLENDPDEPFTPLDPWFLTWFLLALFVWRLTTPLWRAVRWPVPVALLIAVLATMSPEVGPELDLQRILQFLPFFVLGLTLKPHHFEALRNPRCRLLALPVAATALLAAYWAIPRVTTAWLYHRDTARDLHAPWWTGAPMTLALFTAALLLTAAFLAWVPHHRTWYTTLGTGTLYAYLLHGFLAKGARYWGWYDTPWMDTPLGPLVVTAVAAAGTAALCTTPVRRVFGWAVEPRLEWAFRGAGAREERKAPPQSPPTAGQKRRGTTYSPPIA
ncbi:hypothetical protein SRB5_52820 [Streptomyces sp. RB5]|uniref:Acyltransferase 3 domain-containing protein n=1 Tax=Streptomyces smaragdinus TaxID=2585196 RepID=A0A7K0CQS4_9ACTN|nr:acyltransferase family protein [Streptomyces smaragdinus]MQY15104.1 hypothetical protein [Streptomyces smaragdinus]